MRSWLVVAALAACGGSGNSEQVTVHAANAKLTAMRTGGTWKTLAPDAKGDLVLDLDGPTAIAAVCDDAGFFDYYTVYTGPGSDDVIMSCTAVTGVDVTIDAPPTTSVAIGVSRLDGGETSTIEAGTHDVIAVDTSTNPARFEIRRNVEITSSMTLVFDLATTGAPMTQATVSVDATDVGLTLSRLYTKNGTSALVLMTGGTKAWVFPKSALLATDRQFVIVSASTEADGSRSVSHEIIGDETTLALTLPRYLTGASVQWGTQAKATFTSSESWEGSYVGINNADFSVLWDALVLPEFGGDPSTIEIPDPTQIPGWQSKWNIADTTGFEWFVYASREAGQDYFSASRDGTL